MTYVGVLRTKDKAAVSDVNRNGVNESQIHSRSTTSFQLTTFQHIFKMGLFDGPASPPNRGLFGNLNNHSSNPPSDPSSDQSSKEFIAAMIR